MHRLSQLVYAKPVDSTFRAFWLVTQTRYSVCFSELGREGRKQNGFPVCYRDRREILAVNEAAVPENTKKAIKFGLVVSTSAVLLFLAVKLSPKPTQDLLLFRGSEIKTMSTMEFCKIFHRMVSNAGSTYNYFWSNVGRATPQVPSKVLPVRKKL